MLNENEAYRVKNWDAHYENNRSRGIQKTEWLPIPNRLDNEGYVELVMGANGPALFGVWIALLEAASRCKPRGLLIRENRAAHTTESLSRITRMDAGLIADAITRLTSPEIGWLEVADVTQALSEIRQAGAIARQAGDVQGVTERKKEGRKEGKNSGPRLAPQNRKNRDSAACRSLPASQHRQYPDLKEELHRYFQEDGQEDLYPSDRLVVDVMNAAGGAPEQEVIAYLRFLYRERGLKPGTRNGPRHWSWFPETVRNHFDEQRARALPPAAKSTHDAEEFNGMLETVELPDEVM
jgi:hypothetical protein